MSLLNTSYTQLHFTAKGTIMSSSVKGYHLGVLCQLLNIRTWWQDQWWRNLLDVTADDLREQLAASEKTVLQLQEALQGRQSCPNCNPVEVCSVSLVPMSALCIAARVSSQYSELGRLQSQLRACRGMLCQPGPHVCIMHCSYSYFPVQ